jgi:2-methylcitrate dehydratase
MLTTLRRQALLARTKPRIIGTTSGVLPALSSRSRAARAPSATAAFAPSTFPLQTRAMSHHAESAARPEADKVLTDIADYVHNYEVTSELAYETARLCLIDTIGCGLEGLRFPECAALMGPVVDGTVVPNGEYIWQV